MPEVWATRWRLTCPCPDCGKVWGEVVGYGRWHAVGGWDGEHRPPTGGQIDISRRYWQFPITQAPPQGPKRFAAEGADIARSETKLFPCSECLDPERLFASAWWASKHLRFILWWIDQRRAQPPDEDGTKRCIVCGRRYTVGRRSDSAYCRRPRCRKLMSREIEKYRERTRGTRWEAL